MSNVIEIRNLSKIYRLGEIGTGTITRDLERWYAMKIRGQSDPFLKIGETNERDKKGVGDVVYSLRDIDLNVKQGEALGIIGKNGAGKSTLLKILSRVTSPTTGKIHIKGRVASLLEVGTGFHPELTGRENIFLNGAILGMRKNEIFRKLDEIVDFSGVERYIDTPVKRYSSGMYVRLAFAVAAHLESEIMIVDEVLAVGDAEFQRKCLGKMEAIGQQSGRTILFVSHQMQAIEALCKRVVLFKDGGLEFDGTPQTAINMYALSCRQPHRLRKNLNDAPRSGGNQCAIKEAWIENSSGKLLQEVNMGDDIKIFFRFVADHELINPGFGISFDTIYGNRLSTYGNYIEEAKVLPAIKGGIVSFTISNNIFLPGLYFVNFGLAERDNNTIDYIKNAIELSILPSNVFGTGRVYEASHGYIRLNVSLSVQRI